MAPWVPIAPLQGEARERQLGGTHMIGFVLALVSSALLTDT